ncbi:MAG: acyloxyacyl hydrolase, partial [Gemmatimonadota bacterium]|nr:acyloxyacyl hydrolase [Gemmatimonadota bacterium]
PIPDPAEKRLNFAFDAGAATELRIARRLSITTAYKINHISNAGRGAVNPGMNSRMLELGVVVAR